MLTQKIKILIALIFLSVVIFTPQLQLGFLKLEYLFATLGFYFFIRDYKKDLTPKEKRYYVFVFSGIFTLFLSSLFLTTDTYYLKNFFVIYKFFFKAYLFIEIYKKYFNRFNPILILGITLIPYIFSILVFQSNHELATWWFQWGPNTKHNIQLLTDMRVSWLGGQTWDHSIYLTTIYFLLFNVSDKKNLTIHFLLSLILLGAIISARTWMVTYAMAFLFIFLGRNLKSYIYLFLQLMAVVASTYIIYRFIIVTEKDFFRWIWEIFFNFFGKSPELTASMTDLNNQNLTFIQNSDLSLKTILFGDGKYAQIQDGILRYYGGRDSGYIRELLCVGTIFSGLLYLLYVFSILKSYTFKHHKRIALFFIATLFIYQVKGDILFAYFGFFLFIDLILRQRDKTENEHL